MERHVREVKKVAEKLRDNGEIEDFAFDHDKRHHRLEFKVRGRWMSVPFAASPRTSYSSNYAKQQIGRRIKSDVMTLA